MNTQEFLNRLINLRPPGWTPECTRVECYIKKQHPSAKTKVYFGDDPIRDRHIGWKIPKKPTIKERLKHWWWQFQYHHKIGPYRCLR